MKNELDVTVLPAPKKDVGADVALDYSYDKEMNPYSDGVLPNEKQNILYERYAELFDVLIEKKDKISRVTLWGITDGDSWRNDWPMKGRTDFPLMFDRNYKAKPVVDVIIEMSEKDTRNSNDKKSPQNEK